MIGLVAGTLLIAAVLYKTVIFLLEWRKLILVCRKLPSIGQAHWLWGHVNTISSPIEKAERERALIRDTGAKVVYIWLGPFYPLFGVCHPETAKLLLKSTEPKSMFKPPGGYYFLKDWLGMGLLLSYGKKWERNRRLLTAAFHFDILKAYVYIYNEVADTLLKNIKQHMDSQNTLEIYDVVGMATLDTMLRCAFSYKSDVQTNSNPILHSDFIFYLTPIGREFKRQINYVHQFTEEIISARLNSQKEDTEHVQKRHLDFLDILITAKDTDGKRLSDEDVRAEVNTFLFEVKTYFRFKSLKKGGDLQKDSNASPTENDKHSNLKHR